MVHGLKEVRVEPEDFHDFYTNLTKEIKVTSNNSQSIRCLEKSPENKTGKFQSDFKLVLYNHLFLHKKNHLCFKGIGGRGLITFFTT